MTIEWEAGRLDSDLEGVGLDTLAVRAGQRRTPEAEHGEPLFFTSSYVFRSAADAAARCAGRCRAGGRHCLRNGSDPRHGDEPVFGG